MAQKRIHNRVLVDSFLASDDYKHNLLYCRGFDLFYLYKEGFYKELPTQEFKQRAWEYLNQNLSSDQDVTPTTVEQLVQSAKWQLANQVDDLDSPYIAFTDQLYNTDTFQFESFDRRKIAVHHLPFTTAELDMKIPSFRKFLNTTIVKDDLTTPDEDLIHVIQEMFGYYLINNLKAQVVFFLVGPGANGKSVMLNVLEKMIGQAFVSAMSIETLTTDKFATAGLIGKKVNICNEEESRYLRSDRFKALISGDLIQAERKFEGTFAFHPKTKYIFASNALPTFDGVNYGLKRRIKIVPFKRVFKSHEQNRQLTEELLSELPGIVNWALGGSRRLVNNEYEFTESEAVKEAVWEFESATSSSLMFFREKYSPDREFTNFVSNHQLYQEYQQWCVDVGKKPLNAINFHRDIKMNIPDIKTSHRRIDGINARGYFIHTRDWADVPLGGEPEPMTTDDIFDALK